MKILNPTTHLLDLTVSAVLATAIHTAVFGFGVGMFLERDPTPSLQNPDPLEYVAVMPEKQSIRESVKKQELMEKEKVDRKPVSKVRRDMDSVLQEQDQSRESTLTRAKKQAERQMTKKPVREKIVAVRHEEPLKQEIKQIVLPTDEDGAAVALSRYPKPLLKKGWKAYYPKEAEKKGMEGRVEVLFTISPKGRVLHAEILTSSGHAILDNSMVKQLKSIPFEPALSKAGVPVEWRGSWGWNFDIEDPKGLFGSR
ncbi:MAG: TonB family protein [Planctomycetota bacterium]